MHEEDNFKLEPDDVCSVLDAADVTQLPADELQPAAAPETVETRHSPS